MIFKNAGASKGGALSRDQGFEGFHSIKSEEKKREEASKRELTQFEIQALDQMRKNDQEIDTMLDKTIAMLDKLNMHA